MRDRGWKEVDSDSDDWDFFWADVQWVHENFDRMHLGENQRINHFRNHYELTRKDLLAKNMKRIIRITEKEHGKQKSAKFEFMATSYVLPQEHALFQEEFKRNKGSIWIMKPVGKAQGKGIFLVNKMSQISQWRQNPQARAAAARKSILEGKVSPTAAGGGGGGGDSDGPEAYIVQKYIENPYLIGGTGPRAPSAWQTRGRAGGGGKGGGREKMG
ncbi:MAG: tubulin-tyrosine ligase family-domain-containing protein [Olpidium bornovanus]|uniref:Tubulin--tyrosine ligase-like protein 9 n=1 Tax=Olpidium bornovanus TaxID=278681 RepID=A0A8H7ZWY4_9FUNG|nr:MAG: tubulin-tyrosine ligase family-domain-containing protein [Olpidium bornovanus]